jgi:SNF2 family DNA or RNA helicase
MTQPLSRIVKPRCQHCGASTEVVKESRIGTNLIYKLACGHSLITQKALKSESDEFYDSFVSWKGDKLLPFQIVGANFAMGTNARCLITDDTGLGKTVQAFAVMKQAKLKPALIIVKAGLRDQWEQQYYHWVGEDFGLVHVITDPRNDTPMPKLFPITIVSFESLHRCPWIEDEELLSKFKLVVIDEVQKIKSLTAKMTQAVRKVCHNTGTGRSVPHVIGLSATPIKNNAAEYFPILNIIRPDIFSNFAQFTYEYVDTYYKGQYKKFGGLSADRVEKFRNLTSKFIIRRTRDEVMPELPKIFRTYHYNNLSDKVKNSFDNLIEQFQHEYNTGKRDYAPGSNLLAIISMMRYVVGVAKVDETLDLIEEFLQTTTRKLVVFVHHKDVNTLLKKKLAGLKDGNDEPLEDSILSIYGMPPDDRHAVIQEFKEDASKRVLIASTLASGEGLNLQFCSDAIILEFEWNSANEYQAETRFTRIGFEATAENENKVHITRPIAIGTIDEWMVELKEKKQGYLDQALDGQEGDYTETALMKELGEKIMSLGTKKFSTKNL